MSEHQDPEGIVLQFQQDKIDLVNQHPDIARSQFGTERESSKDYEGRVIFEFFQNAVDRAEQHIVIQLLNDRLVIGNDGKPFSIYTGDVNWRKSDFHALCTIHDSSKKAGESVGNKGVGFKSVWNISEEVLVESTIQEYKNWGFRLFNPLKPEQFVGQPEIAKGIRDCGGKLPSFYFPQFYQPVDGPLSITLADGNVIFVKTRITIWLKNQDDREHLKAQIDDLRKTNFCFLNLLQDVEEKEFCVHTEYDQVARINNNHDGWTVNHLRSPGHAEKYAGSLRIIDEVRESYRKRYDNLPDRPNVAVAFPPANHNMKFEPRIYTYLPTNIVLGFNVLVHADFALDNSRTSIPLNEYNIALLKIVAIILVDTISETQGLSDYADFYKFLEGGAENIVIGNNKESLNTLIWNRWKKEGRLTALLKKVYREDRRWPEESYLELFKVIREPVPRAYYESVSSQQQKTKAIQPLFCDQEIFIVPVKDAGLTFLPKPPEKEGDEKEYLFYRTEAVQNRPLPVRLLSGVQGLKISSFEGLGHEGFRKNLGVRDFTNLFLLDTINKIMSRGLRDDIQEDLFSFAFFLAKNSNKDSLNFKYFFETGQNRREERLLSDILVPVEGGGWYPAGKTVTAGTANLGIDMQYFRVLDTARCLEIINRGGQETGPEEFEATIKRMAIWHNLFPLKWERLSGSSYSFSLPWLTTPEIRSGALKRMINGTVPFIDQLEECDDIYGAIKNEPWFYAENLNGLYPPSEVFLFHSSDSRKLLCIPKEQENTDWQALYRVMGMHNIEDTISAKKLVCQLEKMARVPDFRTEAAQPEIYRAITLRLSRLDGFADHSEIPILFKNSTGFHYRRKETVWFAGRDFKRHKHVFSDLLFAYFDEEIREEFLKHTGVLEFKPAFKIEYSNPERTPDHTLKGQFEKKYLPALTLLAEDQLGVKFKRDEVLDRWQQLVIYKDPNIKLVVMENQRQITIASTEVADTDVLYKPVSVARRDNDKHAVGELAHDLVLTEPELNINFSKFGSAIADAVFRNMGLSELFAAYLTLCVFENNEPEKRPAHRFLQEKGISSHDLQTMQALIEARLLNSDEWSVFLERLNQVTGSAGINTGNWMNAAHYELPGLRFLAVKASFSDSPKYGLLIEQLNPVPANLMKLQQCRKRINALFYLSNHKAIQLSDTRFEEVAALSLNTYDRFLFRLEDFYSAFGVSYFDEHEVSDAEVDLEYNLTSVTAVTGGIELVASQPRTEAIDSPVIASVEPEKEAEKRYVQQQRGIGLELKLVRKAAREFPSAHLQDVLLQIKEIVVGEIQAKVTANSKTYLESIDRLLSAGAAAPAEIEAVFHVSKNLGDGLGYDLFVPVLREEKMAVLKVEVKSASGGSQKVYLSENERLRILHFVPDPDWRFWVNGESSEALTTAVKEFIGMHNQQLETLKKKNELYLNAEQWILEFRPIK
jgi:hypothetical protein